MTLLLIGLWPILAAAQAPLDLQACQSLPLSHADEDERDRAGRALYFRCERSVLQDAAVAAKLVEHTRKGTTSAGSIVLLGYLPPKIAAAELARLAKSSQAVKLNTWNGVVPVGTAATVARARSGDAQARKELAALVQQTSPAQREFLLDVVRDFADADVALLLPYLDDMREISSGVPSHATPRRRLADAALVALARRTNLKLGFELNDARRYTDQERSAARKAIQTALQSK